MERKAPSDVPAEPAVRKAIQRFVEEATDRHGDAVGRVVLFGSVARGEATEGSDVDLFVEWDGREWEGIKALVPITTRILLDTGIDLAVHPVSPERLERLRSTGSLFYRNVEREGILVSG